MYKITAIVPSKQIQAPVKFEGLSPIEIEGTATVVLTAREDDAALRFIIGFCEKIAHGQVNSLTITKDDNDDDKTDC